MMDAADLRRLRLQHHGLASAARFHRPEEVVSWFGAMQAQDYLGSLWAIGCRLRRATEARVEEAEARRAIVRTWPMRGTLHFVAAEDVRWMTRLLAPRVMARNATRVKKEFDVDARVLGRAAGLLTRALEGGRRLDRPSLYAVLEAGGIRTGGSRGLHILVWLAMQGILCHAGRLGKQQTFALLDEWVPQCALIDGETALAELAIRYFRSHGPAKVKDFMWWSGLTSRDARTAIGLVSPRLSNYVADDVEYWWCEPTDAIRSRPRTRSIQPWIRLLPAFDEFTVAYRDRGILETANVRGTQLLNPAIVVDGGIVGTWKGLLKGDLLTVQLRSRKFARGELAQLREAIRTYAAFRGVDFKDVRLTA